ncbi:MAG TPA: hypothetical protein VFQ41_08105 [Candidatus Angelobacter sp.]|nr:hypothetical protein [Candidatus Angelobacter sp.]
MKLIRLAEIVEEAQTALNADPVTGITNGKDNSVNLKSLLETEGNRQYLEAIKPRIAKSRGFIAMLLGWLSKRLQFLLLASHFF